MINDHRFIAHTQPTIDFLRSSNNTVDWAKASSRDVMAICSFVTIDGGIYKKIMIISYFARTNDYLTKKTSAFCTHTWKNTNNNKDRMFQRNYGLCVRIFMPFVFGTTTKSRVIIKSSGGNDASCITSALLLHQHCVFERERERWDEAEAETFTLDVGNRFYFSFLPPSRGRSNRKARKKKSLNRLRMFWCHSPARPPDTLSCFTVRCVCVLSRKCLFRRDSIRFYGFCFCSEADTRMNVKQ